MCLNFSIVSNTSDGVIRSRPWSFDPIKKNVEAPKHITLWGFSLDLIFSFNLCYALHRFCLISEVRFREN